MAGTPHTLMVNHQSKLMVATISSLIRAIAAKNIAQLRDNFSQPSSVKPSNAACSRLFSMAFPRSSPPNNISANPE